MPGWALNFDDPVEYLTPPSWQTRGGDSVPGAPALVVVIVIHPPAKPGHMVVDLQEAK